MGKNNYSKIYSTLVENLSDKTKEILSRRFGIAQKERETLESIGKSMGITRERVRQLEAAGFSNIKKQKQEILNVLFRQFSNYFKEKGGIKREDLVLADLSGEKEQSYVLFLLNLGLGEQFYRVGEKNDFYSFWTIIPDATQSVKKILSLLVNDFKKIGHPLTKKDFLNQFSLKYNLIPAALLSYLEISKNIKENKEGEVGLIEWPEINPRGVRDKALLVFQKVKKPLHFTKVASLIDNFNYNLPNKKTLPQTVHNELIKDSRFVLVGRGIYALREWGYYGGTVKDVLIRVMKESGRPMTKEEVIKKVLSQRLVAKNTVLLNLNDKNYFLKDEKGRYLLKRVQTA